jgi:hypothetical protein
VSSDAPPNGSQRIGGCRHTSGLDSVMSPPVQRGRSAQPALLRIQAG